MCKVQRLAERRRTEDCSKWGECYMLEKLKETLINYYHTNNLDIPKSVPEYIKNYPKGYSRQAVLKNHGLKTSEVVELINPSYHKSIAAETLSQQLEKLNYSLEGTLPDKYVAKDRINVKCNSCGFINNTTLDSLRGSTKGCIKCTSKNLAWNRRKSELEQLLLDDFEAELVSNIPENQTGYIDIKHIPCGTIYTSQLVGIVSPNTKLRGTCPQCRSSDRRVVYNNITFGSQFELDCYKILEHLNPELHVLYSKYIPTNRRWVCDFKINDTWIEVSNFKTDYKGYYANLQEKQNIVESNGFNFFFFNSLKDLEDFVELL